MEKAPADYSALNSKMKLARALETQCLGSGKVAFKEGDTVTLIRGRYITLVFDGEVTWDDVAHGTGLVYTYRDDEQRVELDGVLL